MIVFISSPKSIFSKLIKLLLMKTQLIIFLVFCSGLVFCQHGASIDQGTSNSALPSNGYLSLGTSSVVSLSLDNNDIQSHNSVGINRLYLNYYGGGLDLLGSLNNVGDLNVDGNGIFYDNSTNRTGFGTLIPQSKVDIDASSNSDGLHITNHSDDGILVNGGSYGVYLLNQGTTGTLINNSSTYGVHVNNSGSHGLYVNNPGNHGILVTAADNNAGRFVNDAASNFTAIYAGHGDNTKYDLGLGGDGRVVADGLLSFQLDNTDNQSTFYEVSRSANDGGGYVFRVFETGNGYFRNNLTCIGSLSKGSGTFKIDHPLDPENKYLYHSFVESPDMMNIYNGNVTLNESGEAIVQMDAYFDALNRTFRYQLTPIGAPGPNLFIAEEIQDNTFKIAGGTPGMRVSWMVTGIRQDPYAEQNRVQVEVDKEAYNVGRYLHPEAYEAQKGKKGLKLILTESGTGEKILPPAIMKDERKEINISEKLNANNCNSTSTHMTKENYFQLTEAEQNQN